MYAEKVTRQLSLSKLILIVKWLLALGATLYIVLYSLLYVVNSYGLSPRVEAALSSHQFEDSPSHLLPNDTSKTHAIPTHLVIGSIGLEIGIVDSTVSAETNQWPLSDDSVHYANFTSKMGSDSGTMVLYGHNTNTVLARTNSLQRGDIMVLRDSSNVSWEFIYLGDQIVSPDFVSFIYEDTTFRVVIITCNGWHDQHRRLLYFKPFHHEVAQTLKTD